MFFFSLILRVVFIFDVNSSLVTYHTYLHKNVSNFAFTILHYSRRFIKTKEFEINDDNARKESMCEMRKR